MPECQKCDRLIQTGSLCQVCAVEHNYSGVEQDWDRDQRCGVCRDVTVDGDYADDHPGLWLCSACQVLGLTPRQHDLLIDESNDALAGAVRWAVGDDGAYPDRDPAEIEAGFATANQRLVADGAGDDWEVEQQGLDGEPAQGQTTIDGGVREDGGDQ